MEGKEEGVTFRMVMGCSLCAWLYMLSAGDHPLYVGHLPQGTAPHCWGEGYPAKAGVSPAQVALMPVIWVGAVLLVWGGSREVIASRQLSLMGTRAGERQGI